MDISIHPLKLLSLALVFLGTQAAAEPNFYSRLAPLCDGELVDIFVDFLGEDGGMGWMVENPSIHQSIDHLGSQFLFSKLVDALPLILVFVVARRCVEYESCASECLPRVPIP